jgi:hypothetical protein
MQLWLHAYEFVQALQHVASTHAVIHNMGSMLDLHGIGKFVVSFVPTPPRSKVAWVLT